MHEIYLIICVCDFKTDHVSNIAVSFEIVAM